MSRSYLLENDNFRHAHRDAAEIHFFKRRLTRQVAVEMDTTCCSILEHLGISVDGRDEFIEPHVERLQALEAQMTMLILDICREKKA